MPVMTEEPLVKDVSELIFGKAPRPVRCGLGPLEIGGGTVVPEVNFTLPPMEVTDTTWPDVVALCRQMVEQILGRAVALRLPGIVLEFEHLPPMTQRPQWGEEITRMIRGLMEETHARHGIPMALRVTPVDTRHAERPPRMRSGEQLDLMLESMRLCARAGADILSIESVGGKELSDAALIEGDLAGTLAGTAVLGARDVAFLWDRITEIARETSTIPGGDTACGFANTAMVLADRGMIPALFASVVRALGAARTAVAHEHGAIGPTKDCGYEGPVIKALFGAPISMEGKAAACAHFSHVGNVAAACADLWSNESVQSVRLLSGDAPEVFTEILAYDCRLMNEATAQGEAERLRDWLVASDTPLSPQALIIAPGPSLELARAIAAEQGHLARARAVAQRALDILREASDSGRTPLEPREIAWFDRIQRQLDALPSDEKTLIEQMLAMRPDLFDPTEYGF